MAMQVIVHRALFSAERNVTKAYMGQKDREKSIEAVTDGLSARLRTVERELLSVELMERPSDWREEEE